MDRLRNILKTFNEQFGTLFTDTDRVAKRIREDIAPKVAAYAAYQDAKENTLHTARMAHDQALAKVMQHLLTDDTRSTSSWSRTNRSSASWATWCMRSPTNRVRARCPRGPVLRDR